MLTTLSEQYNVVYQQGIAMYESCHQITKLRFKPSFKLQAH